MIEAALTTQHLFLVERSMYFILPNFKKKFQLNYLTHFKCTYGGALFSLAQPSDCYCLLFDDSFQLLFFMSKKVSQQLYSLKIVLCSVERKPDFPT